eukprot:365687-Chlamydomonas_euryale.AAC.5
MHRPLAGTAGGHGVPIHSDSHLRRAATRRRTCGRAEVVAAVCGSARARRWFVSRCDLFPEKCGAN